jgi:hypothetical protein
MKATDIIGFRPPRYFSYAYLYDLPVVSALKNYYMQGFLEVEVPADILSRFCWIQVAVLEVKRPLRNRSGSDAVTDYTSHGDLSWYREPRGI